MNTLVYTLKILAVLLVFAAIGACCNKADASELDYQKHYCNGTVGHTLKDPQTDVVIGYVDCLTETHAWEYDFAKTPKIFEAIGQSLFYAMHTGRRAGIVLIEGPDDKRYVIRAASIVHHYGLPIDIRVVTR